MATTKIEWTDATWSPVIGCTKCSPGCLNCYAERMAIRLNGIFAARGDNDNWAAYSNILKFDYSQIETGKAIGWNGQVELRYEQLDKPLHWRKPRRIFVCSMSDLFHEKVPFEFIDKVFATIRRCPQHTFQILTKRPTVMKEYITGLVNRLNGTQLVCMLNFEKWPLSNAWLGVSISTQAEADEKIPILLQIPAAVRFVSIEPILGPVDLEYIKDFEHSNRFMKYERIYSLSGERNILGHRITSENIDWVVIGAESLGGGPGRECKLDDVRDIVGQCKAAGVPVFVKQLHLNGKLVKDITKFPKDIRIREYPKDGAK